MTTIAQPASAGEEPASPIPSYAGPDPLTLHYAVREAIHEGCDRTLFGLSKLTTGDGAIGALAWVAEWCGPDRRVLGDALLAGVREVAAWEDPSGEVADRLLCAANAGAVLSLNPSLDPEDAIARVDPTPRDDDDVRYIAASIASVYGSVRSPELGAFAVACGVADMGGDEAVRRLVVATIVALAKRALAVSEQVPLECVRAGE